LKADVSDAGEGWSDRAIIKALETSMSMVYRVRKQLVEEGFEAVLSRKQRATPAVARIFDGEKEAKLVQSSSAGAILVARFNQFERI
jgi:transposase